MSGVRISAIIPTRGRPQLLEENWNKLLSLAKRPDELGMCLYIDDDDPASIEKYEELRSKNNNVKAVIGERQKFRGQCDNLAAEVAKGEFLLPIGDDCVAGTQDWDQIVIDEICKYDDRIALVYGNDGYQGMAKATIFGIHKNWIRATGYINAPYFRCWSNDRWLTEVSRGIRRKVFVPELIFTHLKDIRDQTYLDREPYQAGSRILYKTKKMKRKREEDKQKLLAFIEDFREGKIE